MTNLEKYRRGFDAKGGGNGRKGAWGQKPPSWDDQKRPALKIRIGCWIGPRRVRDGGSEADNG